MAKKDADTSTVDTLNQSLPVIAGIARGLSAIALDPSLGVRGIAISRVLNVLAVALEAKGDVDKGLADLDAQVKSMVKEENRSPDLQEWSELHHRSDAAHAAIQGTPPSA